MHAKHLALCAIEKHSVNIISYYHSGYYYCDYSYFPFNGRDIINKWGHVSFSHWFLEMEVLD